MSLARRHRERILGHQSASASPAAVDGPALPAAAGPAAAAAAQMAMRLTHDLRRLKEIQSIERKIAAKREMIPHYLAWIGGLLDAAKTGEVDRGEILPTVMVWSIDTGDYAFALELAEYVLVHDVPLPARYERQAACLVTEEIAEGALKALARGEAFPIAVLEELDALTRDFDMPDEVRAKLEKAIGLEFNRQADAADAEAGADPRPLQDAALARFRRAQDLHERAGVKDRIKRLEKVTSAPPPAASEGEG